MGNTILKPKYKSRFDAITRIDKYQLEWLRDHKDTRTIAGFLDKIINQYKEYVKDFKE
jgi:hypothetical protein